MMWNRIEQLVDDTVALISQAHEDLVRLFRQGWWMLAEDSRCDNLDGAEYKRVLALWIKDRWPRGVRAYILHHANQPAPAVPSAGKQGSEVRQ